MDDGLGAIYFFQLIVWAAVLGVVPALIAKSKGKSFGAWWLYGAALFIVALPHALLTSPDRREVERRQLGEGMRKCPECAEMIRAEARKCRFCGSAVA